MTDDAVAIRTNLSYTPSSSSSRHEVAPNLHDSFGETEDPETRESVMKKSRVDADMENTNLELDGELDTAHKTLHRLLEEIPLESEAVTTAAELNSIRGTVIWKLQKRLLWSEERTASRSAASSGTCMNTCLWTHTQRSEFHAYSTWTTCC